MNRRVYWCVLAAICLMGCGTSSKKVAPVESIAAASGTPQSAAINTAFLAPLVATVSTGGVGVPNVTVTFTAPATGASGTFAGATNTATATTIANGTATSPVFTANGTAGVDYTVTATVAGVAAPANFSLTNTAAVVASNNYAFYLSGLELANGGPNYYALAGAVTIDANGNVLAGEQDYNDAFGFTFSNPISGGTLAVDATTGQGTLTLITTRTELGASGTETLGVQFVNAKHALVIQFDGSATSSGSMDLQTLPSTLSGGYSFTISGVDPNYYGIAGGGVFSISGTALQNGIVDINDDGTVTQGTVFSGTISAPDSFGRGTISNTNIALTINYYIVGPEAIRIIDMDDSDSFVGSAFGQGAATFSNASLGSSVFGVEGNSYATAALAVAGMFTTNPDAGTFQGVADLDVDGTVYSGSTTTISGTYSIASNGYGSLTSTFTSPSGSEAFFQGIYVTDPNLNLNDPNNTASGLGGALVADLDDSLSGATGVLVPQTDTAPASFAGNYAFGAQETNTNETGGWEFDFVGQGSVFGGGDFSGTGLVSDPSFFFSANATDSGVTFTGAHAADAANPGRYTMVSPNWLVITAVPGSPVNFTVVIYQASGGQLFWLNEDTDSLFLGSLQKQSATPSPLSAANAVATTKPKQ